MNRICPSQCRFLGACVAILLLCGSCAFAENDDRLLEQVKQAEDTHGLGELYQRTCGSATNEELDRLKTCRHSGIAIRAAWEEVRRTMTAPMPPNEDIKGSEGSVAATTAPVSLQAMQHFLGFVEGRVRVRQPKWWKYAMAHASYYVPRDRWLSLAEPDHLLKADGSSNPSSAFGPIAAELLPRTKTNILAPVGTSIVRADGGLRVSVGRDTFTVPTPVFDEARVSLWKSQGLSKSEIKRRLDRDLDQYCLNAVPVDAERFVMGFYSALATEYPLLCVNRSSGKTVWEAEVLAGPSPPIGGGSLGLHPTDIEVSDGVVYVFGLYPWSAYIDAFSLADGKNVFRFSTSY